MHMISLGLCGVIPDVMPANLVINNLTDGQARPGDVLEAVLSNGAYIEAYAWGSIPSGNDYGTGANLVVPQAAADNTLYVTVQTESDAFTTEVRVVSAAVTQSSVLSGPEHINIQALAPLQTQPGLTATAGPSLIILEAS